MAFKVRLKSPTYPRLKICLNRRSSPDNVKDYSACTHTQLVLHFLGLQSVRSNTIATMRWLRILFDCMSACLTIALLFISNMLFKALICLSTFHQRMCMAGKIVIFGYEESISTENYVIVHIKWPQRSRFVSESFSAASILLF